MESTEVTPPTIFETWHTELLRRPLKLERAEDIFDAVEIDASLSHDQREQLAWHFYRRACMHLDDARGRFNVWLKEYRDKTGREHSNIDVAHWEGITTETLAAAEREAQTLADFFDLDRILNEQASRHSDIYTSPDHAFGDWFIDQLSKEEGRCGNADPKQLKAAEARLLEWLDADKVKLIMPLIALPDEMRLIRLFRLDAARHKVAEMREALASPALTTGEDEE